VIFGPQRARRGAELKILSTTEEKHPNQPLASAAVPEADPLPSQGPTPEKWLSENAAAGGRGSNGSVLCSKADIIAGVKW